MEGSRGFLFLFLVILTAFSGLAVGQAASPLPFLSGTWIPREGESKGPIKNYQLIISHDTDRVTIVQEFKFEKKAISNTLKLFPDGRGEKNLVSIAGADRPEEIRSKTRWEKEKLVRRYNHCYTTVIRMESITICNDHTEIYSVTPDGNELLVQSTMQSGGRFSSGKRTFVRASE